MDNTIFVQRCINDIKRDGFYITHAEDEWHSLLFKEISKSLPNIKCVYGIFNGVDGQIIYTNKGIGKILDKLRYNRKKAISELASLNKMIDILNI